MSFNKQLLCNEIDIIVDEKFSDLCSDNDAYKNEIDKIDREHEVPAYLADNHSQKEQSFPEEIGVYEYSGGVIAYPF